MLSNALSLPYTFALYAGAVGFLTLAFGIAYRVTWKRLRNDDVTPTGFGVFLAPILLGAALFSGASSAMVVSMAIISVAAVIYWVDDLMHLNALARILISLLAGIGIALAFFSDENLSWPVLLAVLLAMALISVVLTNIVNFYDGADLNLASFIGLTGIIMLIFSTDGQELVPIGVALLAFILPFALMNRHPRTIYLGDSGSFAFACLLTVMIVGFFESMASVPPEIAIPAALPTLDVIYVFVIRVVEKHDMMTRNYLHLYQRLNRRHKGFGYLLPQFINVCLCLIVSAILQWLGLGPIFSVIAAIIVVTVPFYFLCRVILLSGPVEGPLYETNR